MKRLRFIMIGGFLGAGKTTTISRLARLYLDQGRRVGLVTNDQAQDLVDTNSLRAQGFAVEEVAGACFCCRFDDLVSKVGRLQEGERPDVIMAEPVGSCTDLVATVVQPLRDLYGKRFEVAPYPVLFKPSHGLRILRDQKSEIRGQKSEIRGQKSEVRGQRSEEGAPGASGFSPKAVYIFRKQLEEADAIVINRIDEIAPSALAELTDLVSEEYPAVPLLRMSAKTGQGFEGLVELLDQQGPFGRKILDIDYDIYAEGEAELGWLNSAVRVSAAQPLDLDALLLDIVSSLREEFQGTGAEVAHLKAIGLHDLSFGVANLVSSSSSPELSLPAKGKVTEAEVIVNARVAADPAVLEEQVRETLPEVCRKHHATVEFQSMQSFRPGRPQPTHRYAIAK